MQDKVEDGVDIIHLKRNDSNRLHGIITKSWELTVEENHKSLIQKNLDIHYDGVSCRKDLREAQVDEIFRKVEAVQSGVKSR